MTNEHAFSASELEHYSRHLTLPGFGMEKQQRLKDARVLLVGAGGLGCPIGMYLAAAGVGTLGIVDFDRVERSNLQRQVAHSVNTLGQLKTESLITTLHGINPLIQYEAHTTALSADNVSKLISSYDLVIDGTDNFTTRFLLADACYLQGIPLLQGAVYEYEAQISFFIAGETACYRCIFEAPPALNVLAPCAEVGILGVVPGTVGVMMATEAVKYLSGLPGSIRGDLLIYDSLSQSLRRMSLTRNLECPLCGPNPTITSIQATNAACPSLPQEGETWVISPEKAQTMLADGAWALDVREPLEFNAGHLPNALHLPLGQFTPEAIEAMIQRDQPVIVYCQKGLRSLEAVKQLRTLAYPNTYSMAGGLNVWRQAMQGQQKSPQQNQQNLQNAL